MKNRLVLIGNLLLNLDRALIHKFHLVLIVLRSALSEFTVKKGPRQWQARIFSKDGKEVAEITKGEQLGFKLISKKDKSEWTLDNKIDGEHRRFSFSAEEKGGRKILTIRDNVFSHNSKFYMFANHPEGKSWHDYVKSSVRYISRLDNFPYSDMAETSDKKHHQNLRDKIKRFRGIPVGEASGLGASAEGHHVKVNQELEDIGLLLAAASYMMYASA